MNWFVNEYLPRYKLFINVDHKGLLREGIFGWVWATDCDHRPREFEIELHNRMDVDHYTKTLLHELWHVYQHVKGKPQCEEEAYKMENILLNNYLSLT